MRFLFALLVGSVAVAPLVAAPVPKGGAARLIAVSSHKEGLWGVYVVHPDTGEHKRLTDPKSVAHGPTWAPDGSRLAFVTGRGNESDIWTVKPDGSDLQRLTHTKRSCWDRQWSPDGKRIAFILSDDEKTRIQTVEVATGKLAALTDGSFVHGQLSWSPDGARIAYLRGSTRVLHTMRADGTDDRKLAETNSAREAAAWSPDGTRLAYVAPDNLNSWQLYTIGVDGKDRKQLTNNANADGNLYPHWSPDGNHIAFGVLVEGVSQLAVIRAGGGEVKVITAGPHASTHARWSPDGQTLGFVRTKKGERGELWVCDPDGKNAKALLANVDAPVQWKPK